MVQFRNTIPWFFLAALTVLVMVGCDNQGSQVIAPEYNSDDAYFQSVISNDPFFTTEEASLNDGSALPMEYSDGIGQLDKAIYPLRFGRIIESINRNVEFEHLDDTLVVATITKTITGIFVIAAAYSDTASAPDTVIQKPFTSTAVRKIHFYRIGRFNRPDRNWKFKAISLVEGGTGTGEVEITELQLDLPNGDQIVVTSPLDYFMHFGPPGRGIPVLSPGGEVTLRVTLMSASPDTDLVVLRYGADLTGLHRSRRRLTLVSETQVGSEYERVYEITWRAHAHLGKFNSTVDAVTHGTLYDDEAPVSTSFWGVPYIVQ